MNEKQQAERQAKAGGFELVKYSDCGGPNSCNKITVTQACRVNIPSLPYKTHGLSSKKSALFYFNRATSEIAITFTSEESPHGFPLRMYSGGKHGGYIAARRFFSLCSLETRFQPGRYDYSEKEVDGKEAFVIKPKPIDAAATEPN